MTKHSARSGYIIVVTMMMMAMGISIITYVLVRGTSYVPFIDAVRKQEKARSLAFGGLQAAMAQLAMPIKDDNNKKTVGASKAVLAKPHDDSKHLATLLLPKLNRWQQFKLQEHIEGVDATISFAISAEDGKINLNQIYDFENKEFRDEKKAGGGWKKLLQNLFARIEKQVGGKELFKNFEKELKKRQYKFNDVTELLTVPGFIVFNNTIFYEPPLIATRKGSKTAGRPLYLTDIFTIHTQKYTIDPWVFSDSLAGLLELKRAESGDHEQRVKMVEQVIKQFKKESSWKMDWNLLMKPLYQKELQSLPQGIESVLGASFDPHVFSVTVQATIDSVAQRLCAIVERVKENSKDKNASHYQVQIRKIYWL